MGVIPLAEHEVWLVDEAPVDGLLSFDFAFSAVGPPLVLIPMGTAFVPDQGWSLVPEFVSDSITQLFETQVEEWYPETAQFPNEVALDAGLDSWVPSQTQLLWNGHRDVMGKVETQPHFAVGGRPPVEINVIEAATGRSKILYSAPDTVSIP